MSVIVIKHAGGNVSIMQMVDAAQNALSPEALANVVEAELAKWHEDGRSGDMRVVSWREMPRSAIPQDRYFRNAWTDETPELTIEIDMPKAREIHKAHIRRARAPMLAALDVEYQRADEADDRTAKADVAGRKQQLRDATEHPDIAAAKTPVEIKKVWPVGLEPASPIRAF